MARRALQTLVQRCLSSCYLSPSFPAVSRLALSSSLSNSGLSRGHGDSFSGHKEPWMLTRVQHFARRPWKTTKDPYAWVKVGENEPCPTSQPNKGSVKNRNQKKRMAQRDAFRKEQVQASIKSCKEAKARKEEARRKRWKEGAARARAWAERQAQKQVEAKQAEAQQIMSSPS